MKFILTYLLHIGLC